MFLAKSLCSHDVDYRATTLPVSCLCAERQGDLKRVLAILLVSTAIFFLSKMTKSRDKLTHKTSGGGSRSLFPIALSKIDRIKKEKVGVLSNETEI